MNDRNIFTVHIWKKCEMIHSYNKSINNINDVHLRFELVKKLITITISFLKPNNNDNTHLKIFINYFIRY